MKKAFIHRLVMAGVVLLTVPAAVFAQKEDKDKNDKNKDVQIITITRRGNTDDKAVIEINGDKVKVNGKDVEGRDGDVSVRVNRFKNMEHLRTPMPPGEDNFNFNFNDNDGVSLFSEDANRAMLGVVTDKSDKGAEIAEVSEGSAAAKAGLKKGDVITRIDDKKVESAEDVANIVHAHKPGDKVAINVLRNGKEEKVTAELGKWKGVRVQNFRVQMDQLNRQLNDMGHNMPQSWNAVPRVPGTPYNGRNFYIENNSRPKLGMSIQDTEDGKGVKVLDVDDESNAAKAGIKEGDIITQVNDKPVNSADEVSRAVRDSREKNTITFKVQRNGRTQTIEVRTPRKMKTVDL